MALKQIAAGTPIKVSYNHLNNVIDATYVCLRSNHESLCYPHFVSFVDPENGEVVIDMPTLDDEIVFVGE